VQGDIHDIGKTLVVTLLGVNGFTVHDLGRDVSNDEFIEKAVELNVDLIGTSSLLTTTMPMQKELEKALSDAGLKGKVKTIIGGAPVTQRWADRIGADSYAEDAHDAVVKVKELLGK
jgi:trimethylamine corrinoid protein